MPCCDMSSDNVVGLTPRACVAERLMVARLQSESSLNKSVFTGPYLCGAEMKVSVCKTSGH